MVLTKDQNAWGEVDPQQGNIDEETETCVGDEFDGPDIPATNFLHISKHDAPVNEHVVLDLSLPPPPPPPGIAPDRVRKNLTLHTTNGHVTTEIWIRHDGSTESRRVSMALSTDSGAVRATVVRGALDYSTVSCTQRANRAQQHDCSSSGDRSIRTLPFLNMELRADHGDVYLSLPRCFRGPITIRTRDDRIAFSPAFGKRTALISDVSGDRVYFVGDRPRGWRNGNNGDNSETVEDLLDQISIDGKYTSVRVRWDGDEEVPFMLPDPWKGFWSGAERFFATGRII